MVDHNTHVTQFFAGRNIFITGATGFLGKVFLEKLLRSCPDIATIYILIRPKRGKPVNERLNDLLCLPVFKRMHKEMPLAKDKIIPISGDMMSPRLGIKPEDEEILIKDVSVVFHSAATVKFDEPFNNAFKLNTMGTKHLLDLCHKMEKLEAVIHVSTAYSNCHLDVIEEKVYDPGVDIYSAIENFQRSGNEGFILSEKTADTHPNTYTYTKFLAEKIVADQGRSLPIAIVRPSIVTASCSEPVPGWIDNMNGPTGILTGIAKGLIHTVWCHDNYVVDLIPVDIVANLLISVAWYIATIRPEEVKVFNATTGSLNPIRWGDLHDILRPIALYNPMEDIIWYPTVRLESNKTLNNLFSVLFHTIPAYVVDTVFKICGKKQCMVHILHKFQHAMSTLEFFTTHQWTFYNNNVLLLQNSLHPVDKKHFGFHVMDLNWKNYFNTYFCGIKKYLLKEDSVSSTKSVNRLQRMYWIHRICQVFLFVAILNVFIVNSSSVQIIWKTFTCTMYEVFKCLVNVFIQR